MIILAPFARIMAQYVNISLTFKAKQIPYLDNKEGLLNL